MKINYLRSHGADVSVKCQQEHEKRKKGKTIISIMSLKFTRFIQ